jgi:hypothetical protein
MSSDNVNEEYKIFFFFLMTVAQGDMRRSEPFADIQPSSQ